MEPSAQGRRSDNRIANIATMDNDTTVEAFKYLNYCRLAKNSLVSKRFRDLIQNQRHKLARIYVDSIGMYENYHDPTNSVEIFDKTLSPEEYNNWVIHNRYSKQIPLETQIAGMQSTQNERKVYRLYANVDYYYKDSKPSYRTNNVNVFNARTELSQENWPVFQHFFRLLTDPFIFIRSMGLPRQNDALNLLAGAINPDCGRIQCQSLYVDLEDNMQNRISWIKGHVHCYHFSIMGPIYPIVLPSNHDEEFLDFFMTGANCTSSIYLKFYEPCKLIARFVQKFMDLKGCDENKVVGTIVCHPNANVNIDALKRDYADFVVKEYISEITGSSYLVFEFVNNDIERKLKFKICFCYSSTEFKLRVANVIALAISFGSSFLEVLMVVNEPRGQTDKATVKQPKATSKRQR
ncbi:hypothetical protein Ddc_17251 [Ditylenchus destructor]|nr:hypothetical protein Ddc_17251 [Ditylenchus destructor]